MKTINLNAKNLAYWKKKSNSNVIALGFFDGVHKGHQKVIETAIQIGREKNLPVTVMSFFPHPKTVLSKNNKEFNYIMPLKEKAKILERLGVDLFYIVTFDRAFASLSPSQYVSKYLLDFNVVHAVAGYDFSYGKFGAGHMGRMQEDAKGELGVTTVQKVEYQGMKISSTWIRELLSTGDIEQLPAILGRAYELECEWDGFSLTPLPYYSIPADGVYSVTIHHRTAVFQTEVMVSESRSRMTPLFDHRMPFLPKENVSITWHRRIPNGAAYSFTS